MKVLVWLFIAGVAFQSSAHAVESSGQAQLFSFDLPKEPERPRNYILPPIASFFIPGLDQWWEDQIAPAGIYTGSAAVGVGLVFQNQIERSQLDSTSSSRDDSTRLFALGNQIYFAAGSFSAYHSFRSAAKSRQSQGEFNFLKIDETTDQLLTAPFQFHFLREPTTYLPLLGLAIAVAADTSVFRNNGFNERDAAFGAAFSYLAGTNEEALFRGTMMPIFRENLRSDFWSNTGTAVLFSAAHMSGDNPFPWPQLIGGWYLGYLTQKNDWTLAESVFIHTWWDVIAFTAIYLRESRDPNFRGTVRLSVPTFTF